VRIPNQPVQKTMWRNGEMVKEDAKPQSIAVTK
jgi:hypothetical protein